jgi:hypothetical protein
MRFLLNNGAFAGNPDYISICQDLLILKENKSQEIFLRYLLFV